MRLSANYWSPRKKNQKRLVCFVGVLHMPSNKKPKEGLYPKKMQDVMTGLDLWTNVWFPSPSKNPVPRIGGGVLVLFSCGTQPLRGLSAWTLGVNFANALGHFLKRGWTPMDYTVFLGP